MNVISSNQNSVIKEIKLLKTRKYREEKGLCFIEGVRFVEEALNDDVEIVRIIVSDEIEGIKGGKAVLDRVKDANYDIICISHKLFKEVSDTESPQGIMAVIKTRNYDINDILKNQGLVMILESIQDPGNMGTIIRTADAAGSAGVILSKGCVDLYNPKVLRSTMGSVFHLPVLLSGNLIDTINEIKSKGVKIYAAHLNGEESYFDLDMRGSTGIIIGNEANGISDEAAACADKLVKIPMPGRAESLNASIAAALFMYESVRQRKI